MLNLHDWLRYRFRLRLRWWRVLLQLDINKDSLTIDNILATLLVVAAIGIANALVAIEVSEAVDINVHIRIVTVDNQVLIGALTAGHFEIFE